MLGCLLGETRRGHQPRNVGGPRDLEKCKETYFLLEPPEGMQPPDCKIINLWAFKGTKFVLIYYISSRKLIHPWRLKYCGQDWVAGRCCNLNSSPGSLY